MTAHTIERIVYLYFRESLSYEKISYVMDVPLDLVKEAIVNEIRGCVAAGSETFAEPPAKSA